MPDTLRSASRQVVACAGIAGLCAAIAGCGASTVSTARTQDARQARTEGNPYVSGRITSAGASDRDRNPGELAVHHHVTVVSAQARAIQSSRSARGQRPSASGGARSDRGTGHPGTGASRAIRADADSVGPVTVERAYVAAAANPPKEPGGETAVMLNPCTLVSTLQVESITGASTVERVEAPRGPTCIYTLSGSNVSTTEVTLTLEYADVKQIVGQMVAPASSTINGMTAYCGTLDRPAMFVLLPGGDALHITAPCDVAARLAADALNALPTS